MSNESNQRILPNWMRQGHSKLASTETCYVRVENLSLKKIETMSQTQTVSADTFEQKTEQSTVRESRYSTRSKRSYANVIENETKRKPESKPREVPAFIDYKGSVEYYIDFQDIAHAAGRILNWVNKIESDEPIPIAFDMEWPFTFVTGPGRTAVIQLCADINLCYVFHVSELKKLPASLICLLMHDRVCLNGVNIKNDCRKLERDYPEVNSQKMIDNCVDLGVYCNKVCNTGGRWSMERLVWHLCRLKINKDKKVRNSKWHIQPLSPEQQTYAAIDVYISQVMFIDLKRREVEKQIEAKKFIDEFGAAAFEAREKLL